MADKYKNFFIKNTYLNMYNTGRKTEHTAWRQASLYTDMRIYPR